MPKWLVNDIWEEAYMQENATEKKILTLPNALSAIRILLVPLFVWLYCACKDTLSTVIVIVCAGVTDVLDGVLARRLHMETRLGRILDPAADKVAQAAMGILLSFRYPLMFWSLLFFFVKEAILLALGYAYMRKTGIVNPSHWYGKASSVVQYVVVITLLLNPQISAFSATVLIGICIATNAVSLLLYGLFYITALRNPQHQPGAGMRPIDWSIFVMYLLFLVSCFLLLFTSGDSYLRDVLPRFVFVFLRLASIVGITGIPAFFLGEKLPRGMFNPEAFPFRCYSWEKEGALYEKLGIKYWKNRTPDMSKYIKRAFAKQGNMLRDPEHLKKLVLEMCSAEFVHWMLILLSPLFFLLIEAPYGAIIMALYVVSNLCSIMIQRYNRPRIQKIIKRIEKRNA
ncbi:MAG: CDP-alcohol phosphatidyltransferase family protein [Clostridia bacterium]|nr:CDP-alcohol phosphatidyltransferase family protein [Clostridia bacterium]